MGKNWSKSLLTLVISLSLVFVAACAGVQVNTIPAPPPTAKLRVYLQVLSTTDDVSAYWLISPKEFAQGMMRGTARLLQQTGIYEVVRQSDVQGALAGRQGLRKTDWTRNNWALARQVGRAVHAEYALFVDRSKLGKTVFIEMVLINTETEKNFRVVARAPAQFGIDAEEYRKLTRVFEQELFRSAKGDMLATAIRKGRLESAGPSPPMTRRPALPSASAAPPETRPSAPLPPVKSPPEEKPATIAQASPPATPPFPSVAQPPSPGEKTPAMANASPPETSPFPPADKSSSFTVESHVDLEKALRAETQVNGRRRLAVYDLDSVEQYKIVALILSEALREELLKLRLFHLVNRENIVKVLEEMALQQTGLVDEKEAVKAGKGMAVQQIVLGRYGTLGKLSILQAKRLEVETQSDLAIGSLKCEAGREDELLQHMVDLAKEISRGK